LKYNAIKLREEGDEFIWSKNSSLGRYITQCLEKRRKMIENGYGNLYGR